MPRAIGLRDEEAAAQVGVEDQVPVVPGDVEGGLAHVAAGVVDEDVDLAEGGFGFGAPCSRCWRWSRTSSSSATARRPRASISASKGARVSRLAAGEDEVGAGVGERAGEVLAEAAAGAGDEGDLAGEIEEMLAHALLRLRFATVSRGVEDDLHQVRLARVEALEPLRAVFQRSDGGDQRLHLDRAVGDQSMACGYSPDEAQEPCRRICRVTTFCRWKFTSGVMLPTSVTVPPLRTQSIAVAMVSVAAHGFEHDVDAVAAGECLRISRVSSAPDELSVSVGAEAARQLEAVASMSATKTREQPAARSACMVSRPIMPAPMTSAVVAAVDLR